MTSITITPDVPNKKLAIAGDKIALGEKVFVNIPWTGLDVDVGNPYVRLRVEFAGKTIAITEDFDYQNEKFSGYLNLNTVPAMLLKGYPECKFILDNERVPILYGTCIKELLPWRKEEGSDIPVDLTSYPDFVKKIQNSNVSATKSGNVFQMNFAQGVQPGDIVSFAGLGLSAGSVSVGGHGFFDGQLSAYGLYSYYGAEIQGTLSADRVVTKYVETTEIGTPHGNTHILNIHPETAFHNKLKVLGDVEVFGNSGVVANDFTFNKGKSVKTELTSLSNSIAAMERTVIPDAINEVEKEVAESLKGYATTSNLAEERRRASAEEKALNDKVDKLVGEDIGKSARDIASEEVGKLIDGAPAAFDSFKEVAEYISKDETAAQQMLASITQNKADIDANRASIEQNKINYNNLNNEFNRLDTFVNETIHESVQKNTENISSIDSKQTVIGNKLTNLENTVRGEIETDVSNNKYDISEINNVLQMGVGNKQGSRTIESLMPRYVFKEASIGFNEELDGNYYLFLDSYAGNIVSDWPEDFPLVVFARGESGEVMRDFILVVDTTEKGVVPSIMWGLEGGPHTFRPHTDVTTDLVCEEGVNVYFITEFAPDKFVVSRWGGAA